MSTSLLTARPITGSTNVRNGGGSGLTKFDKATPKTFGDRLKHARQRRGYDTSAEAARALAISEITYYHHEHGLRHPGVKIVGVYAAHFDVTIDWLLTGKRATLHQSVPVVGAICKRGKVIDRMNVSPPLPRFVSLALETDLNLRALEVRSPDLYPAYRPGDYVFYTAPEGLVLSDADGLECVVEMVNGEKMLRICHLNDDGFWTLECYSGELSHGAALLTASPVIFVQRAAYLHPKPALKPKR